MTLCSADNCNRAAHARTFCATHYSRLRRHGDVKVVLKCGNKPGVPHSWSRRGVENQSTAKSTVSPSLQDIAWAAGFLEGEGSFVRRGVSTVVSAGQLTEEPLRRLLALFGGSVSPYTMKRPRPKQFWTWRASGARGRGVAMTVYSMMSARRQEQIRNAI
jgi:hypothetical protein